MTGYLFATGEEWFPYLPPVPLAGGAGMMEDEDLVQLSKLTYEELSRRMVPSTVRKKVQAGEIPHRVIAGRIYVERRVIAALVRGREVPARAKVAK